MSSATGMSSGNPGKRKRAADYDEDRRREIRETNRIAARECRARKKHLMVELEKTVANLTAEHAALTKQNRELSIRLETLERTAAVGLGPAAAAAGGGNANLMGAAGGPVGAQPGCMAGLGAQGMGAMGMGGMNGAGGMGGASAGLGGFNPLAALAGANFSALSAGGAGLGGTAGGTGSAGAAGGPKVVIQHVHHYGKDGKPIPGGASEADAGASAVASPSPGAVGGGLAKLNQAGGGLAAAGGPSPGLGGIAGAPGMGGAAGGPGPVGHLGGIEQLSQLANLAQLQAAQAGMNMGAAAPNQLAPGVGDSAAGGLGGAKAGIGDAAAAPGGAGPFTTTFSPATRTA